MPQKRYAYLIGANGPECQNITPLQYAEKDVEHLQRALGDYPCEFSDVKSTIATSPSDVLTGLERLATACERSDLLIVHFSGHGKVWGGHLYLICNDTQVDARLFESTAINISRIKNILDLCSAKHKLLVLDCCHASTAHAGGTWRGEHELETVLQDIKGSVSAILSACASHKRTRELDTFELYRDRGAGFLSWALAAACSEHFAAVSRDGALSLSDILTWLPGVRERINQELGLDEQISSPWVLSERDIAGDDEIWLTGRRREHTHISLLEERRQLEEHAILNQEPFLRQYCFGAEVDDFDTEKVLEYAQKQSDFDRLPQGNIIELCKRLGLASSLGTPRRAAVLAFHRLPSRYISSALIRVTLRTLENEIYSIDNIEGSLGEQVERAIQWLISNLRTISEQVGGGKRIDRCEIPVKALRELVVNAILHRDYEANESVQIKITPRQVVITNAGRLNTAIVMSDPPLSYRESHPRNPPLLDVLIAQRWAEGRARGFEVVTGEFEKNGLELPEIKNLPGGLVQVIIQRPDISAISGQDMTASENMLMPVSNDASETLSLWNVPYGRNPFFTGRESLLKQLHDTLTATKTGALPQPYAITGLGGIGKTQTAIEYAYRYIGDYQAILWARATTRDMLTSDFVTLAELLHLSQKNVKEQHEVIAAVKEWLVSHLNWLLILDEVDDLSMIRDFLPLHCPGHIILTTREHNVGGIAGRIEMERMDKEEGALLLLRRSSLLASHELLHQATAVEQSQAAAIVAAVDGLPLALNQAGAYIDGTGCSLPEYLELYQTRFRELVRLPNDPFSDYRETVATTWSLSFQKVEQENEAAAALLCLCAFLAPDAIPEEIITKGAAHLGKALGTVATDPVELNEAMRVVQEYSLVRRDAQTKTLTVHRVVQAVFKERMNAETQQLWAMRTIQAVNAAFPEVKYETWPECQRYLLHAQACANLVDQYQLSSPEAALLLTHAGWYLRERALYAEAEPLLKRALAIREHVLGAEHPDTATSCNNLGQLYRLLGEYKQAEPYLKRALAIREQVLGAEHPETAFTLHDLGHLQYFLGEYKRAESFYQRALAIREHVLGAEHPDTATTLNHLGQLYYGQGKYEQAEAYYQRALLIRKKIFAPETPLIATALNGLGQLYYAQGKYQEAETQFQRALAIREQTLGPEHPHTTITLNHLGMLYQDLGKYEQAESLHKRVLMIRERALGSQHPDIAFALSDLAHLYHLQGRYAEAEPLYQRALAIKEQKLGSEHPGTATTYSNLARLYQEQERYAEAEPLYQRALHIQEQQLGLEHPHSMETRMHYAKLLREIGRLEEAAALEAIPTQRAAKRDSRASENKNAQ
jgi:tetratricopeptide (TPR) repeat protein